MIPRMDAVTFPLTSAFAHREARYRGADPFFWVNLTGIATQRAAGGSAVCAGAVGSRAGSGVKADFLDQFAGLVLLESIASIALAPFHAGRIRDCPAHFQDPWQLGHATTIGRANT